MGRVKFKLENWRGDRLLLDDKEAARLLKSYYRVSLDNKVAFRERVASEVVIVYPQIQRLLNRLYRYTMAIARLVQWQANKSREKFQSRWKVYDYYKKIYVSLAEVEQVIGFFVKLAHEGQNGNR